MRRLTFLVLFFIGYAIYGQSLTQSVRGTIKDAETLYPLVGATVLLLGDGDPKGTISDPNGNFKITDVPVGRQSFKITFIGYEEVILNNVVVSSGKEVVLNIEMHESSTQLTELVVMATRDGDASNEMALVSARSFTIEETERYAGSRGDPARMASNFAGVQGADDSRNDIVIRGNSPQSVLWRLEGINMPNPNHFNIPGTAGGPVSMINNKTLANSDFYTGAFPAEFGNSIAGVFDLKLRNGNNTQHEYSGQFGFLGTELFGEGPFSKSSGSSYLFSYRYSTLALFSGLGIDIGTDAVPKYQDATFNLNFPLKNNASLSFFGIGGLSDIDILISDQVKPERNIYGENDRDQYFESSAGLVGVSYKHPVSASTYYSVTGALSADRVAAHHELVNRHLDANEEFVVDSLVDIMDYAFRKTKASVNLFYAWKKDSRNVINVGVNSDYYFMNYIDSVRDINTSSPDYYEWQVRWNSQGQALLLQPFIQWKHALTKDIDVILGLHSQYFSFSESFSPIEPRLALKYQSGKKDSWEVGMGIHSQIQSPYLYLYGDSLDMNGEPHLINKGMDFSKSLHFVGGYQRLLAPNLRLKTELYYQHLYNIPIEKQESSISLVNSGSSFARIFPDTLVNEGLGRNYGIELTIEKFFSKGYLFLVTGSLYEAKYQGSDGVWRDTEFNGNYILNALFTKEWSLKNQNTFGLGGKLTTAGGRRYGPVDEEESALRREVTYVDETRNSMQFDPYFRFDVKINYRINRPKVTHEIALDLVNALNIKNVLKLTYAPDEPNPIRKEYQLGFLPVFYYRLDF